jgi:phenylacetate-CoA ligase
MAETRKVIETRFHPASAPDYIPTPLLKNLQLERLQAVAQRAYERVDLYRKLMLERGVKPDDIRSLEHISRLPFTVKSDLRDTYPFGLFASPMSEVVRLHASSGTTGKPIVVAYTKEDLDVWTNAMVRTMAAYGITSRDTVQNSYGYGLFTGGLGFHYGAEGLGATVIPISGGNTDRQIMIMRDFGTTVICSTPSYFVHLIERAGEMGVDIRELPLRVGAFGAEPWSESIRKHIESNTRIKAYDCYGLSEITGPGVGCECAVQNGLHIFEDCFYPEIINPQTGETVPDGEEGELVLTTLRKKAMPLLRYRTRDITAFLPGECPCGRTIRRMRRITRRSDDMFIIRGVNVFPSQVETALLAVEGTLPHYLIVLTREKGLDQMEVQVEVTQAVFGDKIGGLEELQARLVHALDQVLGIRVQVRLVEPHSIQRSEGKAKRLVDRRDLAE